MKNTIKQYDTGSEPADPMSLTIFRDMTEKLCNSANNTGFGPAGLYALGTTESFLKNFPVKRQRRSVMIQSAEEAVPA
jgi:hypothetical protein